MSFSENDLEEVVEKMRINAIEPIRRKTRNLRPVKSKSFGPDYRFLMEEMDKKAKIYGRELMDDICRIISVYYSHGNNIDKMLLETSRLSEPMKETLTTLKGVYDLKSTCKSDDTRSVLTMSRVTELFPHMSMVICDMLNSSDHSKLIFFVSAEDLGAKVHFHFLQNYFPGLIDATDTKAQIALFVHNLCHSKAIVNTGGKEIDAAFVASCQISTRMMDAHLAPADARQKFTKYITETFNFDAYSLNLLFDRVIGEKRISICGTILITPFHEQVLNQQPLTLSKWRHLLEEDV